MSMFNEDGDLINYSDGEDPNAIYDINWDNIKTLEDLKTLLKPVMEQMTVNLSEISRRNAILLSELIDKKIIE